MAIPMIATTNPTTPKTIVRLRSACDSSVFERTRVGTATTGVEAGLCVAQGWHVTSGNVEGTVRTGRTIVELNIFRVT